MCRDPNPSYISRCRVTSNSSVPGLGDITKHGHAKLVNRSNLELPVANVFSLLGLDYPRAVKTDEILQCLDKSCRNPDTPTIEYMVIAFHSEGPKCYDSLGVIFYPADFHSFQPAKEHSQRSSSMVRLEYMPLAMEISHQLSPLDQSSENRNFE